MKETSGGSCENIIDQGRMRITEIHQYSLTSVDTPI